MKLRRMEQKNRELSQAVFGLTCLLVLRYDHLTRVSIPVSVVKEKGTNVHKKQFNNHSVDFMGIYDSASAASRWSSCRNGSE